MQLLVTTTRSHLRARVGAPYASFNTRRLAICRGSTTCLAGTTARARTSSAQRVLPSPVRWSWFTRIVCCGGILEETSVWAGVLLAVLHGAVTAVAATEARRNSRRVEIAMFRPFHRESASDSSSNMFTFRTTRPIIRPIAWLKPFYRPHSVRSIVMVCRYGGVVHCW